MLGTKLNKPIDTAEALAAYHEAATWCNANNARIDDKGDYYEVVSIPEPTAEELAALEEAYQNSDTGRIAALEDAIIELAAIITEGE